MKNASSDNGIQAKAPKDILADSEKNKLTKKFPENHESMIPAIVERTRDLDSGLNLLSAAYEVSRGFAPQPFFFMVGAGISSPPVPLAREIISHCVGNSANDSTMKDYQSALIKQYPEELHRQGYFQKLIDGQYVSTGNFRLAHLLLSTKEGSRFANLVLTTNFDDFLSRALSMFGELPRVYSHPLVARDALWVHPDRVQILHLHGSYQFYDIANLDAQIAGRAKEMSVVVDRVLDRASPIVVGYSGWEEDAFMQGLKRKVELNAVGENGSRCNIFWFCYRQDDLARLPKWLLEYRFVQFIVPPNVEELPAESVHGVYKGAPGYLDKSSVSYSLPCTQVFDALITKFELDEPLMVSRPAAALANWLDDMLPPDEIGNRYRKQYFLRRIVAQMRRYARIELTDFEQMAVHVLKSIRLSKYEAAFRLGKSLWRGSEAKIGLKEIVGGKQCSAGALHCACDLMDAFWSITFGATVPSRQVAVEAESYELVIDVATTLLKAPGLEDVRPSVIVREQLVNALLHRAVWLAESSLGDETEERTGGLKAADEFKRIVSKFGPRRDRPSDQQFPVHTAWALLNLGSLSVARNPRVALTHFSRIEETYDPDLFADRADHERIVEPWVNALCNKATLLLRLNRDKPALAQANAVLNLAERFRKHKEVATAFEKARRISVEVGERIASAAYPITKSEAPEGVEAT